MVHFTDEQREKLLALIKDTEDREIIRRYLQDLQERGSARASPTPEKRRIAKKALEIILRIGFEIGKHEGINEFMHLIKSFFD